eukprot:g13643.t1
MVDRTVTVYSDADHTPDLPLRQIFGRQRVPTDLCKVVADAGLLTVETFAMLGDTIAAVKQTVKTMIGDDTKLGADLPRQELSLTSLAAVWRTCSTMQEHFAARRAKMEEDPNKVPEIPGEDHAEFRQQFIARHPDVVLPHHREPHRKFVERLQRDFMVHGAVNFYEVGEMRTRNEQIAQKSGISRSAEDLLKVVQVDQPVHMVSESQVMDKLHAFFVALEYLNICEFSYKAGPLQYLSDLEEWRHENRGLALLLAVDSLIRKKVYRLNSDHKQKYTTFSSALLEVLQHHKQLWNDARSGAELDKFKQAHHSSSPATPPKSRKRSRSRSGTPPKPTAKARKNKQRRQRLKEQLRSLKTSSGEPMAKAELKAKPTRDARIPADEWAKVNSFKYSGPNGARSSTAPAGMVPPAVDVLDLELWECIMQLAHVGPWGIVDFMVSYHGLARSCTCSWVADGRERQRVADLLVFRSPFEGLARPRMLHLELGPRSLALQAPSPAKALLWTYEAGPGATIRNDEPSGFRFNGCNSPRRSRFWPSEDSFVPARPGARGADAFLHNFLCAAEYSELALLAFVCELSRLLRACEEVPVPQKWVQSSLALLVEAGVAPPRRGPIQPETWVTSRVKIQILGWSKSSLSLPGSTTQDERQDNELPWQIYQHHWVKFTVQLCEVSKGGSSLLGTAELSSFGACESRDTPLTNSMGRPTQVVVTLKFLPLPEPSNFTGLWQAQVERAEHVEVGADSLCVMLTATSRQHSMSHRTREVPNAAEVSWNEEFEFPIIPVGKEAASGQRLLEALGQPTKSITQEALTESMGLKGGLARHLPPLVFEEGKKEDPRAASAGQVAFIAELRSGWYEPRCGLLDNNY